MKEEELIAFFEARGLRITKQRRALFRTLVEHQTTLLRAQQILAFSKKRYEKTNPSTVYRNIELLESFQLLHKISDPEGTFLYKLICAGHHHHHIQCLRCGKIEILEYCPLDAMTKLAEDKGFTLEDHSIELYGYCPKCKATSQ